eukprot:GFUD01023028.1.p2 GENE.GFUD01023028.1~~GFUD01023028.1.p2  ORF type:complete len:118 (-),score=26.63 GFUD01023028.1:768-1121(-)
MASNQLLPGIPSLTPITHMTTLLNYAKKNISSSHDLTIRTSVASFPVQLCLIMSQCPLLATLIRSVPHTVQDSLTILLPQFSSTSLERLLCLLNTGQCYLSQDSEVEELSQIIAAVG